MKLGKEEFGEILSAAIGIVIPATLTWPILEYSGLLDLLRQTSVQMAKFILGY